MSMVMLLKIMTTTTSWLVAFWKKPMMVGFEM